MAAQFVTAVVRAERDSILLSFWIGDIDPLYVTVTLAPGHAENFAERIHEAIASMPRVVCAADLGMEVV